MNKNINALYEIAQTETPKMVGLMCGTSVERVILHFLDLRGSIT